MPRGMLKLRFDWYVWGLPYDDCLALDKVKSISHSYIGCKLGLREIVFNPLSPKGSPFDK